MISMISRERYPLSRRIILARDKYDTNVRHVVYRRAVETAVSDSSD